MNRNCYEKKGVGASHWEATVNSIFALASFSLSHKVYLETMLTHFNDLWAQKLTHYASFWAQKSLKWVSIISGPRI
jgi:hypothetical protein